MAKRRAGRYPKAFRQYAVERLMQCDNIVVLSSELGVHRRLLYRWRDQLEPAEMGNSPRTILALGRWKSPRMLDCSAHLSPARLWQAVEGLTQIGTVTTQDDPRAGRPQLVGKDGAGNGI